MSSGPAIRRVRRIRAALFLAGIGLAGVGLLAGSIGFVRLTSAAHLHTPESVPPAPVALVLGAQVYPSGTPSPFLAARLDLAHRLYRDGKVRVVLVSGDNMAPEYNEPDAMRDYLISAGMPPEAVIADYAGFDTYDSCARARRIFGVDQLVVVTQGYHLPRAVATCRALGVDATGVGDYTQQNTRSWRRGSIRDQFACVKTVIDLLTGRDPVLGQRETSVDDALAR
ncbi:MAG TPA: ElyC/SanA/YdcF family protein [Propionibacteriaceae bacterium]|nr:ElyC/SanA/YdcF family protein [Propionibacteriaceae bacterium]